MNALLTDPEGVQRMNRLRFTPEQRVRFGAAYGVAAGRRVLERMERAGDVNRRELIPHIDGLSNWRLQWQS